MSLSDNTELLARCCPSLSPKSPGIEAKSTIPAADSRASFL
jgi:hypothetical protein